MLAFKKNGRITEVRDTCYPLLGVVANIEYTEEMRQYRAVSYYPMTGDEYRHIADKLDELNDNTE
ncbi:MAG: hypothetical protein OEY89_11285 [Gammaproteobacteria bacterium]|nr:hypothetical protein [Gammaproteobacteria bacterium]